MATNRVDPNVVSPDLGYRAGLNFVTESFDRRAAGTASALSTGSLRGVVAPIVEGDTISQLWCFSATAGVGMTNLFLGVYDKGYNLVASTPDYKAGLGVNAWVGGTVTTNWQSPYTGIVFLAIVNNFVTTAPTYTSAPGTIPSGFTDGPVSGISRISWQQGSATFPATATPSGGSGFLPYIMAA